LSVPVVLVQLLLQLTVLPPEKLPGADTLHPDEPETEQELLPVAVVVEFVMVWVLVATVVLAATGSMVMVVTVAGVVVVVTCWKLALQVVVL
jgi:hypothetical protein